MNKQLLTKLFKLKLEAMGLMTELLTGTVQNKALKCHRELIEVVHQATGEYLAEERTASPAKGELQKVEII